MANQLYSHKPIEHFPQFDKYMKSMLFSGGMPSSVIIEGNKQLKDQQDKLIQEYSISELSDISNLDTSLLTEFVSMKSAGFEKFIGFLYDKTNKMMKSYNKSKIEQIVRYAFYCMKFITQQ